MNSEIWKDKFGKLYEVQWMDLDDACFYRSYPWVNKEYPKMWEGFLLSNNILAGGWEFVRNLD